AGAETAEGGATLRPEHCGERADGAERVDARAAHAVVRPTFVLTHAVAVLGDVDGGVVGVFRLGADADIPRHAVGDIGEAGDGAAGAAYRVVRGRIEAGWVAGRREQLL